MLENSINRYFWVSHLTVFATVLAGCAISALPNGASISLPVRLAWFEGHEVRYVTTDVSDSAVATDQGANFVPRLGRAATVPSNFSLTERVYKLSNFDQRTVFQSAPNPVGGSNADQSYSPLWRMVLVTWKQPSQARELRSEEAILAAQESGQVSLQVTQIVLNCPILGVQGQGILPGVR